MLSSKLWKGMPNSPREWRGAKREGTQRKRDILILVWFSLLTSNHKYKHETSPDHNWNRADAPFLLFLWWGSEVNKWPGGQWSVIEQREWVDGDDGRHLVMMTQTFFQCPVAHAELPETMSNQTLRSMFLLDSWAKSILICIRFIIHRMIKLSQSSIMLLSSVKQMCWLCCWFWSYFSRPFPPADPVCRSKTGVQQAPLQDRPTLPLPLHLPVVYRQLQLR